MTAARGGPRYDDLCAQLESVAEALTDRSIDVLRSAMEAGATGHPAEEKQLAKAQRAVGKAIQVLKAIDGDV